MTFLTIRMTAVSVSDNIRSITGVFGGDGDPTYNDDNTMIDLTGSGDSVVFNDGFMQTGNFTVKILGRDFNDNKILFEMVDSYDSVVDLIYREGWFAADSQFAEGKTVDDPAQGCYLPYFIVRAVSPGGYLTYEILSEAQDELTDGQEYLITLRRVDDVYYIKAETVTIPVEQQE